jgi:4-diphosphocytidyl-2-C-methyl-D-erythritol kinase
MQAARVTGADVPVYLVPRPRVMRGIGDVLSAPLDLPRLAAVLVNPGVAVPTRDVFAALKVQRSSRTGGRSPMPSFERAVSGHLGIGACIESLAAEGNDLEAPAIAIAPSIAQALAALRASPECRLARMSGSGATCFGLFATGRAATAAARMLRSHHPKWWIRATTLG